MAKQARAVQTRRSIVEAAARVFADHGYERAAISEILRRANVTKGALYFHFTSKESLAQAIMDEQTGLVSVSDLGTPLQSVVDITHQFAYALRHDPLARSRHAAVHRGRVLQRHTSVGRLVRTHRPAAGRGEGAGRGAPQVEPRETAEFVVASFTGVQLVSEAITQRADLRERVAVMWRHILPSIAHPGTIARIHPEGVIDPAAALSASTESPAGVGVVSSTD